MTDFDSLAKLQAENARLIALLEANAIEWRLPASSIAFPLSVVELPAKHLGALLLVQLYQSLLSVVGNDHYARKWLRSENLGLDGCPLVFITCRRARTGFRISECCTFTNQNRPHQIGRFSEELAS